MAYNNTQNNFNNSSYQNTPYLYGQGSVNHQRDQQPSTQYTGPGAQTAPQFGYNYSSAVPPQQSPSVHYSSGPKPAANNNFTISNPPAHYSSAPQLSAGNAQCSSTSSQLYKPTTNQNYPPAQYHQQGFYNQNTGYEFNPTYNLSEDQKYNNQWNTVSTGYPQPPNQKRKKKASKMTEKVTSHQHYPVSCGTEHKSNAEGFVPKRAPIPPELMARIAYVKSRLEINPHDIGAQSELNSAMMAYQEFQVDKQKSIANFMQDQAKQHGGRYDGPGQFTGEPLIEPMDRNELDSDDYRTFARPDMFMNLKPLREGYGKFIMRKFGWREGKPLGTTGKGSLAPIELTVKIDRKGLMHDMEHIKRKPEGIAKNEGPAWICKIINGKNPICGLGEMHQAMAIPAPVYELVAQPTVPNGNFKWKVLTTWGSFTPAYGSKSKKQSKAECAYYAIKRIMEIESDRLGLEPPSESSDSCFLRVIFVPSNKSVGGHKMLYKHFYKGGDLLNILERKECFMKDMYYSKTHIKAPPEEEEEEEKKPSPSVLVTGANWMVGVVNGKDSNMALLDLCQAANKPRPDEYSQCINKLHIVTIDTAWGSFTPTVGEKNRKDARLRAAHYAIKEIMRLEAAKFNSKPPTEKSESVDGMLIFSAGKT